MTTICEPPGLLRSPMNRQRISNFETKVIRHAQYDKAIEEIQCLRSRYRPPGQRRLKPQLLLLVGESGAGKSTILEAYVDGNPASETPDGDIRPVLLVESPQRPGRRQFVAAIMNALGYALKDDWDSDAIIKRISHYCEEMCIEIILIDEAQEIVENKNAEATEEISKFIKSLLNQSKTQIVLAGLPTLLELKDTRHLKRRVRAPVKLLPYNWSTQAGRIEYLSILVLFEAEADLPEPSNLHEHELAKRIYCATAGHIGLITKYLSFALEIALSEELPKIDLLLLARVHSAFMGASEDIVGLDFDAPPVEVQIQENARTNPFLATHSDLKALWAEMARNRASMAASIGTRVSRKTRYKGKSDKSAHSF
jgi:hypothetical protein